MRFGNSLLNRHLSHGISLSQAQLGMDAALASISQQAGDPASLLAMTMGSGAFRLTKLIAMEGAAAAGLTRIAPRFLLNAAASSVALFSEVASFRTAHNTFASLAGHRPEQNIFDQDGFWGTTIDFVALKLLSPLGAHNPFLANFAQTNAMVLGHELSADLGFTQHERGSYIERLAHAQVTNFAMAAGMSLMGMLTGGKIHAYERTLDARIETLSHRSSALPSSLRSLETRSSEIPILSRNDTPSTFGETPKPFPELLGFLRESANITQDEMCRRLEEKGHSISRHKLSHYENSLDTIMRFDLLRDLSNILGVHINILIESSNQSHHSEVPSKNWQTATGPLYLENAADARKAVLLGGKRKSLGWLVFSTRKSVTNYVSIPELAKATDISEEALHNLERNEHPPQAKRLPLIIKTLGLNEAEAIDAHNQTYAPKLIPLLQQLFPGKHYLIHGRSEDADKVHFYADHPEAPGRIAFQARKENFPYLSADECSQLIPGKKQADKSTKRRVHSLEWQEEAISASQLPDWFIYLHQLKHGFANLHPYLPESLRENSAGYQLAEAMAIQGLDIQALARKSGLNPKTIYDVLASRRVSTDRTIQKVLAALPKLKAQSFVKGIHPDLFDFFPELEGENRLEVTHTELKSLNHLDLDKAFRAFTLPERKNTGKAPRPRKEEGTTPKPVSHSAVVIILARHLNIPVRLAYLLFTPSVLRHFPIPAHDRTKNQELKDLRTGLLKKLEASQLHVRLMKEASLLDPEEIKRIIDSQMGLKAKALPENADPPASTEVASEETSHSVAQYFRNLIARSIPLEDDPENPQSAKRKVIARYQAGDRRAGNELILSDIRHVVSVARRYGVQGDGFWDLVQEGCIGMMKAAEKFDLERGTRFTTYSTWWIRLAIGRYFKDNIGSLRIPLGRQDYIRKILKELAEIETEGESNDSLAEVAERLGLSREEVDKILQDKALQASSRLEDLIGEDFTRMDTLEDPSPRADEQLVGSNLRKLIEEFAAPLEEMDRDILFSRILGLTEETLENIGNDHERSGERIRQRQKRIHRRLISFLSSRGVSPNEEGVSILAAPPVIPAPAIVSTPPPSLALSRQASSGAPKPATHVTSQTNPRVAIIGFGAAGMAASHYLRQAHLLGEVPDNFKPQISVFEGDIQLGGKIHPNNLGAQFVDTSRFQPISEMIARLNLRTNPVPDYDDSDYISRSGEVLSRQEVIAALQVLRSAAAEALRTEDWNSFDRMSAKEFITKISSENHFSALQLEAMLGRLRTRDVSAFGYAISLAKSESPMPRLEVEGGYHQVVLAEQAALIAAGGSIRTRARLKEINILEQGVRLLINIDNRPHSMNFDFVVVALAPEHLVDVQFEGTRFPVEQLRRLKPGKIRKTNVPLLPGKQGPEVTSWDFQSWTSNQPFRSTTFFSNWEGGPDLSLQEAVERVYQKNVPTLDRLNMKTWDGTHYNDKIPHAYVTTPEPGEGFAIAEMSWAQYFKGDYDAEPIVFAGQVLGLDGYTRGAALSGEASVSTLLRRMKYRLKDPQERNRDPIREFFGTSHTPF